MVSQARSLGQGAPPRPLLLLKRKFHSHSFFLCPWPLCTVPCTRPAIVSELQTASVYSQRQPASDKSGVSLSLIPVNFPPEIALDSVTPPCAHSPPCLSSGPHRLVTVTDMGWPFLLTCKFMVFYRRQQCKDYNDCFR